MPTACSPQDCTSCTSMIGGRPGLYKYLLKIRAVIPLPPVSVRFRFLSSAFLFSSYTVPPLSTKDPVTSLPFPRSTFCAPLCFPPFQLSPASSVCPPPTLAPASRESVRCVPSPSTERIRKKACPLPLWGGIECGMPRVWGIRAGFGTAWNLFFSGMRPLHGSSHEGKPCGMSTCSDAPMPRCIVG